MILVLIGLIFVQVVWYVDDYSGPINFEVIDDN